MKFRTTFVATAMLMLASPLSGFAQGTKYYWGEGEALCSNWTKERQSKSVVGTQMGAWVRGYISGANVTQTFVNSNIFQLAELDAMEAWVNGYCTSHPSEKLVVAVDALVKELIARAGGK